MDRGAGKTGEGREETKVGCTGVLQLNSLIQPKNEISIYEIQMQIHAAQ